MVVRARVATGGNTVLDIGGIDGRPEHVQVHSGHFELTQCKTDKSQNVTTIQRVDEFLYFRKKIHDFYHFYTPFEVGLDVHLFGDFHFVRVVAADK